MRSAINAKRQVEAITRRLRAAAVRHPPAAATGGSSPVSELAHRGAGPVDCWDRRDLEGRRDHRLGLALSRLPSPDDFSVLFGTFDEPILILQATGVPR